MTTGEWIQISVGAVLTLTLGAILWYAWEARKQAKASAAMAVEMAEQRLAAYQPLVVVQLPQKALEYYPARVAFTVKNVGSGPAIDVADELVGGPWAVSCHHLMLLAGESISHEIDHPPKNPSGPGQTEWDGSAEFRASYSDIYGRRFTCVIPLKATEDNYVYTFAIGRLRVSRDDG